MSERAARSSEREEGERKDEDDSKEATRSDDGEQVGLGVAEKIQPCSSPPQEKKDENIEVEIQFDPSMKSEFMQRRGLEQLEEALELIPDKDKVDYVEALKRVPHLVQTESDPIRFLQRENFDAWAAASRLVTYWKMKKEIFAERAFLPLTLTGDGALLPEDVAALETGYFVLLPNDCEGRPVLCHDDTRLDNEDTKQKLRVFFYLLSIIAENPLCQTDGFSTVALISQLGFPGLNNRNIGKYVVDLLEKAMPVRFRTLYLLRKSSKNNGFLQMVFPRLLAVFGDYISRRFIPVFADSEQETIQKLKSYGFQENCLPLTIGGSWNYEFFDQWMRGRKQLDREQSEQKLPAKINTGLTQSLGTKSDVRMPVSMETDEREETVQKGLQHLQAAVNLIPYEEKIDYLEALDRVPSLVQAESDPVRFLRCEGFDGWAAARRMVDYWRHRKALFGDRAFLPMSQTGKGALTEEEVNVLKSGFLMLLPCDDKGRSVFCVDKSQMPMVLEPGMKNRCFFYMLQVTSENEAAQREGFVVLYRLAQVVLCKPLNPEGDKLSVELATKSMPARCKKLHILCLPPKSNRQSFLEAAIPITLRLLKSGSGWGLSVHVADSEPEMRQKLQALGFDATKLPLSLGGSWSYGDIAKWQRERREHELQLYNDFENQEEVQVVASSDGSPLSESQRHVSLPWVEPRGSHTSGPPEMHVRAQGEVAETMSKLQYGESLASTESAPSRAEERIGLEHLAEALDMITSKSDYLVAKERVPYLVATESDPLRFLQSAAYDPLAAARRLVTYWQQRRAVFGERAFLPLDQTGHGALSEEDLRTLSSGFLVELPRDSQGRTVLCLDTQFAPGNGQSASVAESRMRCSFYMLQVASENELSRTDGLVMLMKLNTEDPHLPNARLSGEIFAEGMPVRLKVGRLLCCLPAAGEKSNLEMSIFRTSQAFGKIGDEVTTIHIGESESELLRSLQELGFTKESVPTTLGGDWKYESRESWNQQRRFLESTRQKEFLGLPETAQFRPVMGTSLLDVSEQRSTVPAERVTAPQSTQALIKQAVLLLSASERAAYMEARERAPELVERAFVGIQFLRVGKEDIKRGAERVAKYWEIRKELFGERAFLPLDQTGNGALTHDDIAVLKTGFFVMLPPDTEGRPVIFVDTSRLERAMFCSPSKLRVAFYVLSLVAENEMARTDGIICLGMFSRETIKEHDPKFYRIMVELLSDAKGALPVQVKNAHVLCCTTGYLTRFYLKTFVPGLICWASADRILFHVGETQQLLAIKLQSFGLCEHSIPSSLGGSWSYYSFAEWQRERLSHESKRTQTTVKYTGEAPFVTGKASDQLSLTNITLPSSAKAGGNECNDPSEAKMSTETRGGGSALDSGSAERTMVSNAAEHQHENALLITDAISFVESESTKKQALAGLEEPVQLLPESDKSALLDARRLIPGLVEKESDPVRFLRFERYNMWAAAKRLATYWSTRKDIFGELAFRPMSQTGEGTLHRGDLNLLKAGHLLVLPNDSDGRTVLCYDSSRDSDSGQDLGSRIRLAFYLGCIAAENEVSQRDGCVILLVLSKRTIDGDGRDEYNLLRDALPVRIHTIHIVNTPVEGEFVGSREALKPFMLDSALKDRVVIHAANTKEKLLHELRVHGLSKEGLPKAIGGDWSYEMFVQWQDFRTRFEWELPTRQRNDLVGKMFNFSFKTLSKLSEEDRTERKRRLNVLHSRRQRERQRIEVEVLREQVSEIREKNQTVVAENQRFEQLLESARSIISASPAFQLGLGLPEAPPSDNIGGFPAHSTVLGQQFLAQDMGRASQWSILSSQDQGGRDTFGRNIYDRAAEDILLQQLHREALFASDYSRRGETTGGSHATSIPNQLQQTGIVASVNSVYTNLPSSRQANAPFVQRHPVESLPDLAWRQLVWDEPPAEEGKDPR